MDCKTFFMLGHPLFFRSASNAFPDVGSVGRIVKKILKKKSQEVSEKEPLVPQEDVKS